MRIFHITTPDVWAAAQQSGTYTVSTRGRTLEQEGFPDRLSSPWRSEQLAGADQPHPHVYGPLDLDAVVDARPL